MESTWLDDRTGALTSRCPLPPENPFTLDQAELWGVSRQNLRTLLARGAVRRVLRGVYVARRAVDDMDMRARALGLVVPPSAVVTDRTAAWLHGVDVLPRSALTQVPPVHAFFTTDSRMRRPGVTSGRRGLEAQDITVVSGVRVTTALRTALDLGRMLWRFDALGALDGFVRIGVPQDLLVAEVGRFRGYRGVRQLRALAPLADPRSESMGESALRLHWYDAGLGRPELQLWVYDDRGVQRYRLDITDPDTLFAAEYDGEQFHSQESDREYDETRRAWCHEERGWEFEVFTKADIYDRAAWPVPRLKAGSRRAAERTLWTPYRRG